MGGCQRSAESAKRELRGRNSPPAPQITNNSSPPAPQFAFPPPPRPSPRVVDRGGDLGPISDDAAALRHEALDVGLRKGRHLLGVKAGEGSPVGVALGEDRRPIVVCLLLSYVCVCVCACVYCSRAAFVYFVLERARRRRGRSGQSRWSCATRAHSQQRAKQSKRQPAPAEARLRALERQQLEEQAVVADDGAPPLLVVVSGSVIGLDWIGFGLDWIGLDWEVDWAAAVRVCGCVLLLAVSWFPSLRPPPPPLPQQQSRRAALARSPHVGLRVGADERRPPRAPLF